MYPNVRAEMSRQGLTQTDVSKIWNVTVPTVSLKLSGKYPITLDEAVKLKKELNTTLSLEELFKRG